MATVVVTFFLVASLNVYKMDATWLDSQRDQFLSQREKRWSMNSQRVEEIVAQLMKPISSDGRRSFDTDLSALLEEYLTEAGLHALDADEGEDSAELVAPNFTEIALLLQQSATIYGIKVDFLYNHVLSVSESLVNGTHAQDSANDSGVAEEPHTPTGRRRRRRPSGAEEFAHISLQPSAGAAREAEAPRPPPTLPRMYLELEPRVASRADVPLFDYCADGIGLLSDFQVAWRLHEGTLVDELEGGQARAAAPRPVSLLELQAAIEAAAPPSPPPLREESPCREDSPPPEAPPREPSPAPRPLAASTPLPAPPPPPPPPHERAQQPAQGSSAVIARQQRKRRSNVRIDEIFNGHVKIQFGEDLLRQLKEVREFSIDQRWILDVVGRRKIHILNERKRLIGELDDLGEPDDARPPDKGFLGWSGPEVAQAQAALDAGAERAVDSNDNGDDGDDGFFEQSSGGSSERGAELDPAKAARRRAQAEIAAWKNSILKRAAAAEARGTYDVHELGARVLDALRHARERPQPVLDLLREHARQEADVSRLVLATLFLANAGNVEIEQGPPLALGAFSLRLLSSDTRRFRVAALDEARDLR